MNIGCVWTDRALGHTRIGTLPASRKWRQVIELIGGGADVREVAAATAKAAERSLANASDNAVLQRAFWLLTQIPLAARQESFSEALRAIGLLVGEKPTLPEICTAMLAALDRMAGSTRPRSDLDEMARLSAVENLNAVVGRNIPALLGPAHEAEDPRKALCGLATVKQFGVLARDFFSRLARRCLDYFLSRELPNHVGVTKRFHSLREHREFEEALDLHCREAASIVRDFAGEWYSRTTYEGGIDEGKAGRFAFVAFKKLRAELEVRRGAHA